MNEFSAQIFDQLDGYTPEPDRRPDWRDVVVRARKQRTHRLLVVLAAAVIVLGSATAVTAALGGFDSWLVGEPGKPASNAEQERFAAANRSLDSFPKDTKLRELVQADVGGKHYELYGFRSGASLCLRLKAVSLGHSIGPLWAEMHISGSTTIRTPASMFRASPRSVQGNHASLFRCRERGAFTQWMQRLTARREGRHTSRQRSRIQRSGGSFAASGAVFLWAR